MTHGVLPKPLIPFRKPGVNPDPAEEITSFRSAWNYIIISL
jgi:hypothetical protein